MGEIGARDAIRTLETPKYGAFRSTRTDKACYAVELAAYQRAWRPPLRACGCCVHTSPTFRRMQALQRAPIPPPKGPKGRSPAVQVACLRLARSILANS